MKRSKSPAKAAESGQFRIISGQWRGRKLRFPAVEGLRPTPDRVRETLFNWLSPYLHNASCLDLYSGCGALGLEALSRGATACVFVDQSVPALAAIKDHLQLLGAQGQIMRQSLPEGVMALSNPVDIVFIDPPYADNSQQRCVELLLEKKLLKAGAWVYCESASAQPLALMPSELELHRHKTAGAVQSALYRLKTI